MTRTVTIKQETEDDKDVESSDSSPEPPPLKKPHKKNTATKKRKKKKISKDISFDDCFRFEATCPYKECLDYSKTIFKSQQSYQQHHALKHERRDRFRNNLVWKCPQCQKICSSFYNFSAHVSMHRNVCKPPWICTLPAAKHGKEYSDKEDHDEDICGKRSSTKNNLISHIRSVHSFNVIGYKERTRTEHYSSVNAKKRKRKSNQSKQDNKAPNEPKFKRPRVNSTESKKSPPSLYPFLLQMYRDGVTGKAPTVSQGDVLPIFSENVDKKPANVMNIFPGFNSLRSNMNHQYDNITVTAPMPPSNAMNVAPVNRNNNSNNNNNNEPALPTLKQLSNLCQLLQTLKTAEQNHNNAKPAQNPAENADMSTVVNCINYIKNCQQHQHQHQAHGHHHHHHRHHRNNSNNNNNVKPPSCEMHQAHRVGKCRHGKNIIHMKQMKQMQVNPMMMKRKQANNMNMNMNLNMNAMRNRNVSNMNLLNANNRMHNMNNNMCNNFDMNDENDVTLSIQNMIKTLNHMEHVSNINGLGMSNMHKMNGMNSVRNVGNRNRINNITIHNNINNISNGTNNNANQPAFHSNLPSLREQY